MAEDQYDWVEIIEPSSSQRMYANVKTGECLWEPPEGVNVKPKDDNQWWELVDQESGEYYYHNAVTNETVWERPDVGDIIPLTELQSVIPEDGETQGYDNHDNSQEPSGSGEVSQERKLITPPRSRETTPQLTTTTPTSNSLHGSYREAIQDPMRFSTSSSHDGHHLSYDHNEDPFDKEGSVRQSPISPTVITGHSSATLPRQTVNELQKLLGRSGSVGSSPQSSRSSVPTSGGGPKSPPTAPPVPPLYSSFESPTLQKEPEKPKRSASVTEAKPAKVKDRKPAQPVQKLEEFTDLSRHKTGFIIKKKVSIANMLSWTKDGIKAPMILTSDKQLKKDSPELFKLVQMYMNDRKGKGKSPDKLALEIATRCWEKKALRDEVYIQLCRQTTNNTKPESLQRGWELFTICLTMFPPSMKFRMYLEGYLWRHVEPETDVQNVPIHKYASYCHKRVERMALTGGKKGVKKPTLDEITMAKAVPFNPSMFGGSLEDILETQREKLPKADVDLPWVVVILADTVLRLKGLETEGIFRVPGDIDEVHSLKLRLDKGLEPPDSLRDPHIPASLLKLWFRELEDPLIPENYYDECINNAEKRANAVSLVHSLPMKNKLIAAFTIRFLQNFVQPGIVDRTKMGLENISMVWAPNFLRCPSEDHTLIFQNARREMAFLRTLLKHLNTGEILRR